MEDMRYERTNPNDVTEPMLSPTSAVYIDEKGRAQEILYTVYDDVSDLRAHNESTVSGKSGNTLAVGVGSADYIHSSDAILANSKDSNLGGTDSEDPLRETWGGKAEFLLTLIGYAVGLGNVWRFPYLCYKNGGGAFLIPYILMLALVGLPLFYMEIAFGQFASLGPITIWKINPLLKGLGYLMVISCWLVTLYYAVVISHALHYIFSSMAAVLPWTQCGKYWNTGRCLAPKGPEVAGTTGMPSIPPATSAATVTMTTTINTTGLKTAAEEYYENFVLGQSSGISDLGAPQWRLTLALLLTWVIVMVCLIKGIQSLGKVVYFTAVFPYIMLTILLIRGATLDGALNGVIYYLKPDFSRLADSRVWTDAATQIFYSLSACTGGMIAMSSFSKFKNNCYRDAVTVAVINCGTSVYAGFVIFSVLGFMAHEKGVEVSAVAKDGPGLAFIVYPEALARMPVPQLWSIFFFLMMATLGFGSLFSMVETVLSALIDEFPEYLTNRRNQLIFRCVVISVSFLLGLPMVCKGGIYLLTLVDFSLSGFPLLIVGLTEVIALNWIYGYHRFADDIKMMLGKRPNIYWRIMWQGLSPVILICLIVFSIVFYEQPRLAKYRYPAGARAMGWLVALTPIAVLPGWFLYKYCRHGGYKLMNELMEPDIGWGPALKENRTHRYGNEIPLSTPSIYHEADPSIRRPRPLGGSLTTLSRSNTPNVSLFTLETNDGSISFTPALKPESQV